MRWLYRIIKLIVLLVIIYLIGRFTVVFLDSLLLGQRAPYFQQQTDNSIIVRWQTLHHAMGVVRYGESPDYLEFLELEEKRKKRHSVKLTHLKPNTRYYYKVGDIDGFLETDNQKNWFQTSPVPGSDQPVRIWAIGDSGEPGPTARAVRDAMYQWVEAHPREGLRLLDVWLALGDNAYRSGTNDQYQAALFDMYPDLLSNTVLWPVYGNHDARRWTYFRLFDLPEQGEAGGVPSGTENYYSFDYADVHFIVLDSQESQASDGSEMVKWLRRDLKQNKRRWTIAAFHHPAYSKGSHDSDNESDSGGRMTRVREKLLPILERGGVDVVLSGHSHMYERSYLLDCHYRDSSYFEPQRYIVSHGVNGHDRQYLKPLDKKAHQGAVYIVDGSSSKVDQGPINHPANVVSMMEAGSVIIDVEGNTLTARFINDKAQVRDQFSITKSADYQSQYKGCKAKASS